MLHPPDPESSPNRRCFLRLGAAGLSGLALAHLTPVPGIGQQATPQPVQRPLTQFQIACMTLPYSQFPLQRALQGIRNAGYRYVAWGTTHREGNQNVPVMAPDAAPERARELGQRCRDMGLEPVMMFSGIFPEAQNAVQVLTNRIHQAAAARIPHVLTFGHTRDGNRALWIQRFRQLGPIARQNGVLIVIKQHGGETGTGRVCAEISREVNDDGVRVNYDAGNVMDYLNLAPARIYADLESCADQVRGFCIKDHRLWPRSQDCGPGFGEIDHYRLLNLVAFTGRPFPLSCENIFAPLAPRPTTPEGVDVLARRAREFLEVVIHGLQQGGR
jgi:sugar phosphate isomerase/epimerase